jgi:glycosyltransferase involved in cell wall biosynthesis
MVFSIILPIYNVEKFLCKSINSLLAQTYTNFEIILVNDGSVDNSPKICEAFANNYSNITYICQENKGVGISRNVGLNVAKGDYVFFCDPDDFVESSFLEDVYKHVFLYKYDLVLFGYSKVDGNEGHLKDFKLPVSRELSKDDFNDLLLADMGLFVWDKVIKRDFLIRNNIFFDEKKRSQDISFALNCLKATPSLFYISECYYNYRVLHLSSYNKTDPHVFENQLANYISLSDLVIQNERRSRKSNLVLSHYYNKWFLIVVPLHIYNDNSLIFFSKLDKLDFVLRALKKHRPIFSFRGHSCLDKFLVLERMCNSVFLMYLNGLFLYMLRQRISRLIRM